MDPISERFYADLYHSSRDIFELSPWSDEEAKALALVEEVLTKRSSAGLDPASTAVLLRLVKDAPCARARQAVIESARNLRRRTFGLRYAAMVPIEITSFCTSNCRFCGWRADNRDMIRVSITEQALRDQARILARQGFSHFEIAGGDVIALLQRSLGDYIAILKEEVSSVDAQARVSVCVVPLHESEPP